VVRRFALAAVLLFSATACATQSDNTSPTPSSPSTTPVVPLPVAKASTAALRVQDMPKGWDGGVALEPSPNTPGTTQYDPAECRIIRSPLEQSGKPVTAIRGQYYVREPGDSMTELIYSWPTDQLPLVRRISDALPGCSSVNATRFDHTEFSFVVKQLPVPSVKDGITLRFVLTDRDYPNQNFVQYTSYVVRDGTVLILYVGDTFPSDATYAQFLTKAVARLDAVVD